MIPKIAPPPTASHFELWMLTPNEGRSRETGKRFRAPKPERLYGEATAQGQLPETWPVSAFSPVAFVKRWGPGRYRVMWLSASGAKLGSKTFVLADPSPTQSAEATRSLRARGEVDPERASSPAAGAGGLTLGPLELMAMLDARSDAERQRASADNEMRMQRDREFFAAMQAQMTQMLAVAAKGGTKGEGSSSAGFDPRIIGRELELMRRESALTLREGLSQIRGELTGLLDEGDGDEPPPKDLGEATERMGIELVQELTREAPELLQKALPAFWGFLTKQGYQPSEKLKKKMAQRTDAQRLAAARAERAAAGLVDDGEGEEEESDGEGEQEDERQ